MQAGQRSRRPLAHFFGRGRAAEPARETEPARADLGLAVPVPAPAACFFFTTFFFGGAAAPPPPPPPPPVVASVSSSSPSPSAGCGALGLREIGAADLAGAVDLGASLPNWARGNRTQEGGTIAGQRTAPSDEKARGWMALPPGGAPVPRAAVCPRRPLRTADRRPPCLHSSSSARHPASRRQARQEGRCRPFVDSHHHQQQQQQRRRG
ncbi:hypothetical protein T492DRAFT_77320 [Pavlovales sp. CCMP2436]|nr:hypothetical protein T492DRAFT_77320 [Pavlovales sp. CCMP2436]